MNRRITTLFFVLTILSVTLNAQTKVTIALDPYGVTPYMVALSTTDIYDYTYTGLQNVGVGTKVYLQASIHGKKFGTLTYTFTRKPFGATAAINATKDIQNDSVQVVFFTADLPGTYSILVADGIYSSTELVINAAKYLGYTNTIINGVDTKLSCNTCHSDKVSGWLGTNHATLFTRAMSATPGISGPTDHYSVNCIKCHTTGYDANPTAINDGFDDLGFVYPTVITATTNATLIAQYPEAMKRGNIQCESCHGPAGAHLGNTSDNRITVTFEPDVCAYCHESGTNHIIAREFRAAAHATNTLDGVVINESGAGREACVRCHTGKGFAQFADGIPTSDPYFDSGFYPITCAGCHDPHNADNQFQLRKLTATLVYPNSTTPASPSTVDVTNAGLGTLCINCHQSRTEANAAIAGVGTTAVNNRFGPHHGPQGDILVGNNMLELSGVSLTKSNHIGKTVDACVTCHMYNLNRIDTNGKLILSGGHSFEMSTPDGVDNMEACAQCHGNTLGTGFDQATFVYNGKGDLDGDGVTNGLQVEVKGMIAKIMAQMPKTSTGAITPSKDWTKDQLSAYWNALTAQEDKSNGIHNPKYVVSALLGAYKLLGISSPATDVKNEESIPSAYTLYQNYPNPFNPTTNIKFALPQSGRVKLTIYDALGREVETLINNELAAGTHIIAWNAKNMASGIYLYRIEANNFVQVNKMLLVK